MLLGLLSATSAFHSTHAAGCAPQVSIWRLSPKQQLLPVVSFEEQGCTGGIGACVWSSGSAAGSQAGSSGGEALAVAALDAAGLPLEGAAAKAAAGGGPPRKQPAPALFYAVGSGSEGGGAAVKCVDDAGRPAVVQVRAHAAAC